MTQFSKWYLGVKDSPASGVAFVWILLLAVLIAGCGGSSSSSGENKSLVSQLRQTMNEQVGTDKAMPGAVLGVAQGDRVLMLEAFGVSNTSTSATLATDHLLNIGSAGKAMTSLLIGALIDDGILTWDTRAVDNEYGLGQEISTLSNLTYIGHAGSFDHFNSVMGFYPEKDIAFIFITNGESEAAEDLTEMDGIPHEIAKMLQDF